MNFKIIKNIVIICICFLTTTTLSLADASKGGNLANNMDDTFIVKEDEGKGDIALGLDGDSRQFDKAANIAELRLENGTTVKFINEGTALGGEERIGMFEITAANVKPVLSALIDEYQPTPLEVYLALASPDAKPPAQLLKDHQRAAEVRGNIQQKPRLLKRLEIPEATPAYKPEYPFTGISELAGAEVSSCAYDTPLGQHFDFLQDVSDAFGAALPNHGHGHDLTSTHYGVTGFSSRRALGTCNASGYVKSVRISYEWIQDLWVNEIVINDLMELWLFPGQRVFYYSDSWPLIFRYRIRVGFTASGIDWNTAHTEGSW